MKIPKHSRMRQEEVQELDERSQKALENFDESIEKHNQALDGRLTLSENVLAERFDLELSQDAPVTIELQRVHLLRQEFDIVAVLMAKSDYFDYYRLRWQRTDTKKVQLAAKWDTAPGRIVKARIWVLAG